MYSARGILKALITSDDSGTPRISHTKLWSNLGMLAMTVVFLHMAFTHDLQEWYGWMYALVVTPTRLVNKFLSLKFGRGQQQEEHNQQQEYHRGSENQGRYQDKNDNYYGSQGKQNRQDSGRYSRYEQEDSEDTNYRQTRQKRNVDREEDDY